MSACPIVSSSLPCIPGCIACRQQFLYGSDAGWLYMELQGQGSIFPLQEHQKSSHSTTALGFSLSVSQAAAFACFAASHNQTTCLTYADQEPLCLAQAAFVLVRAAMSSIASLSAASVVFTTWNGSQWCSTADTGEQIGPRSVGRA